MDKMKPCYTPEAIKQVIEIGILPKYLKHIWIEKSQNKTDNWKNYVTDKMGKVPSHCTDTPLLKNGTADNWQGTPPRLVKQAFSSLHVHNIVTATITKKHFKSNSSLFFKDYLKDINTGNTLYHLHYFFS